MTRLTIALATAIPFTLWLPSCSDNVNDLGDGHEDPDSGARDESRGAGGTRAEYDAGDSAGGFIANAAGTHGEGGSGDGAGGWEDDPDERSAGGSVYWGEGAGGAEAAAGGDPGAAGSETGAGGSELDAGGWGQSAGGSLIGGFGGEPAMGAGGSSAMGEAMRCWDGRAEAQFDRSCEAPEDCIVATHWEGCCRVAAVGLSATERKRFEAFETVCGDGPACGCCCDFYATDEGSLVPTGTSIGVDCVDGACVTFVEE